MARSDEKVCKCSKVVERKCGWGSPEVDLAHIIGS
jgi:hypothetical protein